MRRRLVLAFAGLVVLAASVALALVGRAVLTTPAAVALGGPGLPSRVEVAARRPDLAARAAAALLDSGPEERFARVVGIYDNAVSLLASAGDPRGPVAISRLVPSLHSPQERAEALTMAGTLLAYSAGAGFGALLPARDQAPTAVVLAQAVADFQAAIRSDPTGEAAKYDLELLLRQRNAQAPPKPAARRRKKAPATQDHHVKPTRASGQEHHAGIYATGTGY